MGAFAGLSPLVLIICCGFTAIAMPLPVLSIEVHDAFGLGVVAAGWAIGAQSIATVLTRHLAGVLADAKGPKTAVLAGLPLASVAGLASLLSVSLPLPPELGFALLVAGRLVLGLAESLFLTGSMSWGIGRIGAERTGKVMAWQGIAIYAALGIGAPIGIWMQHGFGFRGVAIAAMLLPLLALVAAILTAPVRPAAVERVSFHRLFGLIWRPGLVLAFATAPYAAMASFLALDYASRGWQGAGLALSAFAGSYILVRLFLAHLPDRLGGLPVACVSLVIEGAGQALIWLAPSALMALCGSALSGIGFSLVFPAMGVLATRRVSPAQRGRAVGNYIAFFDMALGLTAPAAGFLAAQWGYPVIFLAGVVSVGLALISLLGVARTQQS
jgi:MFS family permease